MAWVTPKTDWSDGDYFDISDYNRIIGNVNYLYQLYIDLGQPSFTPADMGSTVSEYSSTPWNFAHFNAVHTNLSQMCAALFGAWDPPEFVTYVGNGSFCTSEDLNEIEGVSGTIYRELHRLNAGVRRIPFTLGQYKTRI